MQEDLVFPHNHVLCSQTEAACGTTHLTPARGFRSPLVMQVRQGWFVGREYRAQGTQRAESTARHTTEMKGEGAAKGEANREEGPAR